ncbi:flagellar hook-associated protein FlgL [Paenibacillus thermotolerans]|uniref:flagellar hook-associated protein FlgL n=1 Tax=Paenibacillus thermotolerans TaxID=3027807 RepID=UPI002367C451|nr:MULTISPECIES: flagellar hook-associated protein FlgL [unclassified Paenibacillus]
MLGRITQGMMNTQLLRNLNSNLTRMNNLQDQLTTGRRINRPSDDPVGLSYAMRYRSDLSATDQYQENVDTALSWLEFTDTMLNQAGSVFQRARELTVQGANGTNSELALDAIKEEMKELYNQLVQIGNSEFNGKHVFNGQRTDVNPFTEGNAANESTDDGIIEFEIGVGVRVPVNVPGNQVFGSLKPDGTPVDDNAFKVLQNISDALDREDFDAVREGLGKLDSRIDKFLEIRADLGAKMNRVELANERLKDISINLQTLQTKTEDADYAEVITNLKTSENVYQASLSVGAQIIRPSLVDFLK